ncbi:MAG: RNA 2',3'-cyclic phosphodiesterase [Planctomycetes bacterium]|nr:RNA 2',3'-cyclic phosphodiesterase [Planctomycetota bacterium]
MRRIFVALMLGAELGAEVAAVVERATHGANLRRYAPADLHATLFFLGATPEATVASLKRELERVASRHGPFDLVLRRAGAFPEGERHRGRERVFWIDVAEARPGGLARLAADVAAVCVALGARAEERPWRAHVTVARAAGARASAQRGERVPARRGELVSDRFFELDLGLEWKPNRVALVESLAGRERADGVRESYRVVADFALAAR